MLKVSRHRGKRVSDGKWVYGRYGCVLVGVSIDKENDRCIYNYKHFIEGWEQDVVVPSKNLASNTRLFLRLLENFQAR